MSAIRSAIDEFAAMADTDLSVEELAGDITELAHVSQQVDVLMARKTKSLIDRGGHVKLGYSSPAAFLADQARMSAGHAKRVVSEANAADKAPFAFAAWADGRLSSDQAHDLFRLADAVPDQFPDAEQFLVGIVEGLSVTDTRKALEYWRQSVDGPGDLDSETQWARRGLSSSKTVGGMTKVDGWLTPSAAEAFVQALNANMAPPKDDVTRTPRQRRHDALEDLCRDWLDHGDTPTVGGEKPHIMVLGDLPALQGIAGGTHETLNGDIISVDALRQLACDASISRIVLGPDSEVLDVGRKTRVWTAAQRRAIIARDRHCQGNGCERDPRWCDIHHIDHWADGGETTVDKGLLLCRPCHTIEHFKEAYRRRRRLRT